MMVHNILICYRKLARIGCKKIQLKYEYVSHLLKALIQKQTASFKIRKRWKDMHNI